MFPLVEGIYSLVISSHAKIETTLLIWRQSGQNAVKDMIIAFAMILGNNSRLLQQVLFDFGSLDHAIGAKVYIYVFAKAAINSFDYWPIRWWIFYAFSIYRDELSFRMVLAFPKASKMGFASRICCSIHECLPLIAARYCRINFVLSVFPAPDSPEITIHWSWRYRFICAYALSPIAKMCGGSSPIFRSL